MDTGQRIVRAELEDPELGGRTQHESRDPALASVLAGPRPASAMHLQLVVSAPIRPHRPRPATAPPPELPRLNFSPREMQTLYLVACGRTRKQIAAALGISVHTVDVYRRQLIEKLGLRKVVDLQRHALLSGWLRLEAY